MNRREASKQDTRALILEAAHRLFSQKGSEECTLRDIAREAGVAPASLIVHFKSKTALLDAALSDDLTGVLADRLASIPKGSSLLDRVMHLAEGFLRTYAANRALYRTLVRNAVFQAASETPAMTRQTEYYMEILTTMISTAKEEGAVRSDVDATIAAGGFFSLYLGALAALFRLPEIGADTLVEGLRAMTEHHLMGISR